MKESTWLAYSALVLAFGSVGCGEATDLGFGSADGTASPDARVDESPAIRRLALTGGGCSDTFDPLDELAAGHAGTVLGAAADAETECASERRTVYELGTLGSARAPHAILREQGSLSRVDKEKLARPWLFTGEGEVLAQEFWGVVDEQGQEHRGQRVVAIQAPPAIAELEREARHEVSGQLSEMLNVARESMLKVVIHVHSPGGPKPLPRLPARPDDDPEGYELARQLRAAAFAARDTAFASEAHSVLQAIETAGGRVEGLSASVRTVVATLPAGAIPEIAATDSVDRVLLDHQLMETGNVALGWDSDGSMPGLMDADHVGQTSFGYKGENGSSSPIMLGITESYALEDEACMLDDGTGCTAGERLKRRHVCTSSSCSTVSNYSTTAETGGNGHPTKITSVLTASYYESQDDPNGAGEPTLDADWRELATGVAPEATVDFATVEASSGLANAYDCLSGNSSSFYCREVEVINTSIAGTNGSDFCSINSSYNYEDALEQAWDDDVLTVASAGNMGSGSACRVMNPSDTPLAFTVGSLDGTDSTSYDNWSTAGSSPNGGASGTFGSVNASGTISLVDLVAAGDPQYMTTRLDNGNGTIVPESSDFGTSYATPQIAGAAALIKEYRLDLGDTWINQVGFLHAHLLAMGDRYTTGNGPSGCASGSRLLCGADLRSGFGRLKLQKPSNWSWYAIGTTFTSTASSQTYKFSFPIPTGSDMLKCVMFQREPMANKNNLSLVGLHVRIRDKVSGNCVVDNGSSNMYRAEANYDFKHMVTVLDSEVNIENRCADVDLDPVYLSSDGSVTTYTYCYTNTKLDDE